MIVIDYHIDIPEQEREELVESLNEFRVWVEGNYPGDPLFLQGHPGMSREFINRRLVFNECMSGSTYDLWIEHSYDKKGCHQETYWCYNHCEDTYHDNLTVDEYNYYFDQMEG